MTVIGSTLPAMTAAADDAELAAHRLDTTAGVILVVVSILAILAVAGGVGFLITADTTGRRWAGGYLIGAGMFAFLSVLLPCMAAQAVARYIMLRAGRE